MQQALYQKTLNPDSMTLQLTYPIADLRGIKLHLERNFYGVQTTAQNNITNMEHVKVSVRRQPVMASVFVQTL